MTDGLTDVWIPLMFFHSVLWAYVITINTIIRTIKSAAVVSIWSMEWSVDTVGLVTLTKFVAEIHTSLVVCKSRRSLNIFVIVCYTLLRRKIQEPVLSVSKLNRVFPLKYINKIGLLAASLCRSLVLLLSLDLKCLILSNWPILFSRCGMRLCSWWI